MMAPVIWDSIVRLSHDAFHRSTTVPLSFNSMVIVDPSLIKLWTPEGEKVFPLERLEVKAKPIKEGSTITIELNENGTVVDLWKAS